MKDIQTV